MDLGGQEAYMDVCDLCALDCVSARERSSAVRMNGRPVAGSAADTAAGLTTGSAAGAAALRARLLLWERL